MLDVINSVGLSSSVLKMIERRHKNDLYLALGGMVGGASVQLQAGAVAQLCDNHNTRPIYAAAGSVV
jgi:hypothetical protein